MRQTANFETVPRQSLSESVFEQLRGRILAGELSPGSNLPSERVLSELLGVNRGAVREGLKRLQQARLITVRHGGATQIRDWRDEAGLEMLPQLLVDASGRLNIEAARGILSLRQALAPTVAAAAAAHGDSALPDGLDEVLDRWRDADTATARQALSLEYWSALVAGSGNIAFRLTFNSLQATYRRIRGLLTAVLDSEFRDVDTLAELNMALRRRECDTAHDCAARHVALGTQAVNALLDSYAEQQGGAP